MKLSVTKGFIDKDTAVFHNVGEVVEYPETRAKEIEYKGFGKCLDEPKPTKTPKQEKEADEPKKSEEPKKVTRKKK